VADLEFRRDLYRETAAYYDRFRLAYPSELIEDLAERSHLSGSGTMLDLACGTGQIAFAMCGYVAEIWAVDQEPGMIDVAAAKARTTGAGSIRCIACAAEDLSLPPDSFDLVAIGNAFHRLPRQLIAARTFSWLRPGGFLALLWGGSPWDGDAPWQQRLTEIMEHWRARAGIGGRIPAGYEQDRRERPDLAILRDAGFEHGGTYEFEVAHEWTAETIIGFLFSTSILSPAALGSNAGAFKRDVSSELHALSPTGRFRQDIRFDYVLACRPG
jgi:SAM-dependent methyltransferase